MRPIVTPSGWFLEIVKFGQLTGFDAQTGLILLQDVRPGSVMNEVIIRPVIRFEGDAMGVVKLDLVDEYDKSLLTATIRVGVLTNTHSYYHIMLADVVPLVTLNTAPDKIYAKFSIEDPVTFERSKVSVVANVNLGGKYFTINANTFVWYNTGGSVQPVPGGAFITPIAVNILTTDSIEEVAKKTYLAMSAVAALKVSWDEMNHVLILGAITNVADAAAGTSGFAITKEMNGATASANLSALYAGEVEIYIHFAQVFGVIKIDGQIETNQPSNPPGGDPDEEEEEGGPGGGP